MADRGSAQAQYKLSSAYAYSPRRPDLGLSILYGLEAYAGGYIGVEPLLAKSYRARALATARVKDDNPDTSASLYWAGKAILNGVDAQSGDAALTQWSREDCMASGKTEPKNIEACIAGHVMYSRQSAKVDDAMLQMSDRQAEATAQTTALKLAIKQREPRIRDLDAQEQSLLAEKARLEAQLAREKK
jgi:hypothetical protein